MLATQIIEKSEVIIFDLFHTLVSFKSDGTSGQNTSEILGIPQADWNRLLWENSDQRLRHNHLDDVSIIRDLAHLHDASIPEPVIKEAARERASRFHECLTQPPVERIEILSSLHERGHKLVLLSNADSMECRGWNESPLAPFFTATLFSCDTGLVKPDPEAYQDALNVCMAEPAGAVFVGDGGSGELRGARDCGITTIMTTEIVGEFWPELIPGRIKDADYVIGSLKELL